MESLKVVFTYLQNPWLLGLAVLLCGAAAFLSYFRFLRERRLSILFLAGLRFVALLIAVIILLRPVLRYEKVVKQNLRCAVLVDVSRSMAIRDSVGGLSRFETACDIVRGKAIADLARAFDLQLLEFGDGVRPFDSEAGPRDEKTALREALRSVSAGSVPLAAVVLISDGGETEAGGEEFLSAVPLWAIPVGSGNGVWNCAVTDVKFDSVVLVGNRTRVTVSYEVRGEIPPGAQADAILKIGGEEGARKPLSLTEGSHILGFTVVPRRQGLVEGEVVIGPAPGEAFGEDNRRHFFFRAVKEKLRVLLYEPSPRWEFTFLLRALRKDPDLETIAVLRTASKQLHVEGTPPVPLMGGLPGSARGFSAFNVIVLGDVTGSDLLEGQAGGLLEYVRNGGGLIVVGGKRNLSGALEAAGVGPLLPAEAQGPPRPGRRRVFPVSAHHPVLRGLLGSLLSADGVSLRDVIPLGSLKPGAETLLAAGSPSGGGSFPVLVVHRFGKGRVAATGTEGTWQWAMNGSAARGELFHKRFWGQLVRWVSGRKEREKGAGLSISKRVVDAGESVTLHVAEGRGFPVTIEGPDGTKNVFFSEKGGRKEADFSPLRPGRYKAAFPSGGKEDSLVFYAEPNPAERATLSPAREALSGLARRSGGGVVKLPDLNELPRRIVRSFPGAVREVEETPEKNPLLLLLFTAAVCLEWFLRRRIFTV